MVFRLGITLSALLAVSGGAPVVAQTTADQVLSRMDELQHAKKYESATIDMRLFDEDKEVRRRTLRVLSRIDDQGAVSALVEFTSPPDIRGLRLLTIQTDDGDDQRIYLPALRRVQRIAGSARDDSFAGSDLSYEDLRVREKDDYTSEIIDSTDAAWVISSVPMEDDSPYSLIEAEVDKSRFVVLTARYFDRKGRLKKVLSATDFQNSDGIWKPSRLTMTDVRQNRRTELVFLERDFETVIAPDVFSDRYLRRGVQ